MIILIFSGLVFVGCQENDNDTSTDTEGNQPVDLEHDASTETLDLRNDMRQHRRTGDFSTYVRVEPHTEQDRLQSGTIQ